MYRCPWRNIAPEARGVMLTWWGNWKRLGKLPYSGDLGAQPYYVVEAIEALELEHLTMENERNRDEVAQLEAAERERERQRRNGR